MVLIDTNILIDLATGNPKFLDGSREQLNRALVEEGAGINVLVYTKFARGLPKLEEVDAVLPAELDRLAVPYAVAGPANRAFAQYRKAGGSKTSPLVDFFIGAHAEVKDYPLLTRDPTRYRTYFPTVKLITPSPPVVR